MAKKQYSQNIKGNESISKFKLLSAYGGPGSIVHTSYGSIIISCIEEWGFLKQVLEINDRGLKVGTQENKLRDYVIKHAKLSEEGEIGISNDFRLLDSLKDRKKLSQLKYLVLIPKVELNEFYNTIKSGGSKLAINSSFMPKIFFDKNKNYKSYNEWYNLWIKNNSNDNEANNFFPPKYIYSNREYYLVQDNIVLICDHGHISDFPWSNFLSWRTDFPNDINIDKPVDLLNHPLCCGSLDKPSAKLRITTNKANASGFDGKSLKCENCGKRTSLQGLMSVKIKCTKHKPWEAKTFVANDIWKYDGNPESRNSQSPVDDKCYSPKPMKVALTTGNNIYYSRVLSSIYMPDELFKDQRVIKLKKLEKDIDELDKSSPNWSIDIMNLVGQINSLKKELENQPKNEETTELQKDIIYRFEEFRALSKKSEDEINLDRVNEHLKVKDVTNNIEGTALSNFFSRILRIDNMKITSAQLDFSRVVPVDSDADGIISKNIFRNKVDNVQVYPVVENYGEGIFFAFNEELINLFSKNEEAIGSLNKKLENLHNNSDTFSEGAIKYGLDNNWQLYLVHSFAHLIMRELEFKCGYPTASLSERIYVSNDPNYRMYGCMIYTTEGAEGSMGGVIAQTRPDNLIKLITNALERARICNSDPLCWESDGQGLFELNFASCFSCSLVSETSCEHRNIYLDRRILVDENYGFFKEVLK